MIEVVEYVTADGRNYYRKWFNDLSAVHARKVATAIRRMEAGNLGVHKGVGHGVFEHKIYNPALRIYYGMDGQNLVILLAGGSKSGQSADIEKAQRLWHEYKAEKQAKARN